MQSDNTADLAAALAKAQAGMKSATFNKINPHFKNKYADLAAVLEAVRKPLADNGLSVTQTTEIREGGFVLVTTLRHATGQWIGSEYPLPVGATPQQLGSALTYARRYSLSAIACIAADDEDDDAEGSSGQTSSAPRPVKPTEAPVNPETGELTPHAITAPDTMKWGALFVAAIKSAQTPDEVAMWISENAAAMDTLKDAAPKIHDRVMANVNEKLGTFKKAA